MNDPRHRPADHRGAITAVVALASAGGVFVGTNAICTGLFVGPYILIPGLVLLAGGLIGGVVGFVMVLRMVDE